MIIRTKLDILTELGNKKIYLPALAKLMDLDKQTLEKALEWIEDQNGIEMSYLPIPFIPPSLHIKHLPNIFEPEVGRIGRKLESYNTKSKDEVYTANVTIYEGKESNKIYFLDYPQPGPATYLYLNKLKEYIAFSLPAETSLMTEEDRIKKIYKPQFKISYDALKPFVLSEEHLLLLTGILRSEMYGIGVLEYILIDPNIEEIVVNNSKTPVFIYHRKYGWMETNIILNSEDKIRNLSVRIARSVGKQITILDPLLDAHLIKGERVNAVLYPIAVKGNNLTIRKFSSEPFTLPMLIENHTLTADMGALLWQATEYEMNSLFVGGTASGKTTMMNAMLMFINPKQRILTIEDTRELNLPDAYKNWIPLITRSPNPEGLGEVDLLTLLVNSLRMRPDKIIVGEVRRKEEAIVMFEAMHTGHSVYATFHADTADVALRRLQEEPIDLPASELSALDLLITQRRDRETGLRRTFEIALVSYNEGKIGTNNIYYHKVRSDTFAFTDLPIRYIEKMNMYTGMLESELKEDLKQRAHYLTSMVKKDIKKMDKVVDMLGLYYADKSAFERLLK